MQEKSDCLLCSFVSSSGPEVIKLFSCSTQLSKKFIMLVSEKSIMLINVKIVGILTLNNMINTTSERLKAVVGILVFMSS